MMEHVPSTNTRPMRSPRMPPAHPGQCRFLSVNWCILPDAPLPDRAKQHTECADRWRIWNDPQLSRDETLRRASYQCAECLRHGNGMRYPEADLEADHIVPFGRPGGTNHPDNRQALCKPHHEEKSAREARARNPGDARTRARTDWRARLGMRVHPNIEHVGEKPRVTAYAGGSLAAAATSASVGLLAHTAAAYGAHAADTVAAAGFIGSGASAALGALAYCGANTLWWRDVHAQVLYAALADVTRDDPGHRRDRLRIYARQGGVPVDVRLAYGPRFPAGSQAYMDRLIDAFADTVGVDPSRVEATPSPASRRRAPSIRLRVLPDSVQAVTPEPPVEAVDMDAVRGGTVNDLTEAARAVLGDDGVTVNVTAWSGRNPAELAITYPPRVAKSASTVRADLSKTITELHPPAGAWFLTWESARRRFLLADRPDPLQRIVPRPALDPNPNLYAGVCIGENEDGSPWLVPLMGGVHVLVAGATGAGKGSVLWGLVLALRPLIRDGRCRLWIADPKSGVEFAKAKRFAHRYAVAQEDIVKLLQDAAKEMDAKGARLARLGLEKVETPSVEFPLDLVIIDEIAGVVGQAASAETVKNATPPLVKILTQGRAPAFTVVAAVQDPRKENLRQRALFTYAVCLRLSEAGETGLILGNGARSQGALADLIPMDLQGTAYTQKDDRAGFMRSRAAKVEDVEKVAAAAELSPTPEPRAVPGGEQLSLDKAPGERRCPIRQVQVGTVFRFVDDPDEVTLVDSWPSEDDDSRVVIEYLYAGESTPRRFDLDDGEEVIVVKSAVPV